jgi:hypothetical protein
MSKVMTKFFLRSLRLLYPLEFNAHCHKTQDKFRDVDQGVALYRINLFEPILTLYKVNYSEIFYLLHLTRAHPDSRYPSLPFSAG